MYKSGKWSSSFECSEDQFYFNSNQSADGFEFKRNLIFPIYMHAREKQQITSISTCRQFRSDSPVCFVSTSNLYWFQFTIQLDCQTHTWTGDANNITFNPSMKSFDQYHDSFKSIWLNWMNHGIVLMDSIDGLNVEFNVTTRRSESIHQSISQSQSISHGVSCHDMKCSGIGW